VDLDWGSPIWALPIWNVVAAVGQALGALFAGVGLFGVWRQIKAQSRIASAEFVLQIEELLDQHEDVAGKLAHGGPWDGSSTLPPSRSDEMRATQRYMALLERIGALVKARGLPVDWARDFYGWRVRSVARNKVLLSRLQKERDGWSSFIWLAQKLGCVDGKLQYRDDRPRPARASDSIEDDQRR
jgi:hypothetical protein